MKFFSRKFLLTLLVLGASSGLPVLYKQLEISEIVTLTVLGIIAGIGTAYGFINLKESKIDLMRPGVLDLDSMKENDEAPK